jgi:uncharacterized protein DUF5666
VGGTCPDITFVLSGAAVYADKSTKYKGGNCKHFEGDEVIGVSGTRESDGRVRADEIDLRKPKK